MPVWIAIETITHDICKKSCETTPKQTTHIKKLTSHAIVIYSTICNHASLHFFTLAFGSDPDKMFIAEVCGAACLLSQFVVTPGLVSNGRSLLLIDAKAPVLTVPYPYSSNRFLLRYPKMIQDAKYVAMMTSMQLLFGNNLRLPCFVGRCYVLCPFPTFDCKPLSHLSRWP